MITVVVDHSGRFGDARHQGMRSTCLACAASDVHASERKAAPLSAEYLFYHAAQRQLPVPHEHGLYLDSVIKALAAEGQCLEQHYPYDEKLGIAAALPVPPAPFPHRTFLAQVSETADAIPSMLDAGATPILISNITRQFQYASQANDLIEFNAADPQVGMHAIVAVGFGTSKANKNYIKVRNSWGARWGNHGHAWLSEEYVRKHIAQVATLKP